MSPGDHRLVVLAAVLVPRSAEGLLQHLSSPDANDVWSLVDTLSKSTRAERLEALVEVLSEDTAKRADSLRIAATAERPRVARVLLEMAQGLEVGTAWPPVLARVLGERGWD